MVKFNSIRSEINYISQNDTIDAWEYRVSLCRALSYIGRQGGIEDCSALRTILEHFGRASMCDNWERKWYYPAIYDDMMNIVYCDMTDYPFTATETLEILRALDNALNAQG